MKQKKWEIYLGLGLSVVSLKRLFKGHIRELPTDWMKLEAFERRN